MKVTIAWHRELEGEGEKWRETKESHEFDTLVEAQTFLHGVEEGVGYDGFEIVDPDPLLTMTDAKEDLRLQEVFIKEKGLMEEFNLWLVKRAGGGMA